MKIRCERSSLADALKWVTSAVPSRPSMPLLMSVKLSAKDGLLTASAFDFENAHTERMTAEVGDSGEVLVNAFLIRDLVASLPGAIVELESDDSRLHVRAGRSTYRAPLLPMEEYPALPETSDSQRVVDADVLRHAVHVVSGGIDPTGPVADLRGLRIEAEGNQFHLVGTNRHRLSVARLHARGDDILATVPVRPMEAAVKGLSGHVEIGTDGHRLSLRTDGQAVTLARLGSEDYPAWRKLWPARSTTTVTVERGELIEVVKRLQRIRPEDKTPVYLDIEHAAITLHAGESSQDGREVVDAESDGEIHVAFNPDYLAGILSTLPGERARLGLTGSFKPVVIEPDTADPDTRHLLMPIRSQREA